MAKKNKSPLTTPDWRAAVQRRTRFYILVAVLLAVLFGILVYQFFSQIEPDAFGETTIALVSAEAIPSGTRISENMIEVRTIPLKALPDAYLTAKEQAIGQLTLYPFVKGEIILPEKLAKNQGSFLAQRCPTGSWCISLPVSWFIAIPPDLEVGDRLEIASALPGKSLEETGFIATQVQVIGLTDEGEDSAYLLALDDQEALKLLYSRVNGFQMLVLLRPAGG